MFLPCCHRAVWVLRLSFRDWIANCVVRLHVLFCQLGLEYRARKCITSMNKIEVQSYVHMCRHSLASVGGRFKSLKKLHQIRFWNYPTLCIGFKRSTHCDIRSSKSSSSERLFKVKPRASFLKFILVQTSSGIMAKVTVLSVREEMHQKEEGGRFCLDRFPT